MKVTHITLFLIIFFSLSSELVAQKPVKFYGIAKDAQPLTFYQEQSKAWHKLVQVDAEDAEAWVYYYKANRAILQLELGNTWVDDKDAFYKKLQPILQEAKKDIGNSLNIIIYSGSTPQEKNQSAI